MADVDVDPTDRDPLIPHTDDDDDADTPANPFPTEGTSTSEQGDERYPMTTMNRTSERGSHHADTSFIEGTPSGRIMTSETLRIQVANETLQQEYPNYGKDGKVLTLAISKGRYRNQVVVVGPKGGETPLFKADGRTINPKISKTDMKTLGPTRAALIQQSEEELDELVKRIEEQQRIADNENEEPSVREQARERVQENTERRDELVNETERLKEGLPLRERLKEFFKKNGVTIGSLVAATGIVLGVVLSQLKAGLAKVAGGVGNALSALGKKIASILPGLLGAIVSFVFRAAGQAISFLGKNAWLLVLAVAAFLIDRTLKRNKR